MRWGLSRTRMFAIKQEMTEETPSLPSLPPARPVPDRSVLGLCNVRPCDHAARVIDRRSSSQEEFDSRSRSGSVKRERGPTVNKHQARSDDNLAVLVSLVLTFGMLVGGIAAVWMWTIVADRRGTVVSTSASETP